MAARATTSLPSASTPVMYTKYTPSGTCGMVTDWLAEPLAPAVPVANCWASAPDWARTKLTVMGEPGAKTGGAETVMVSPGSTSSSETVASVRGCSGSPPPGVVVVVVVVVVVPPPPPPY